ncbi:MAG: 1-deoxy-D-xylulose-5-phosphate reductoisomerase [Gemmatimonadetes bacterium]|nr:1-deoxy-D-xylulose-5-phosphate reductoisomerase [Gemmatimonadota bacterium]
MNDGRKSLTVLGSTGSIGRSTLDVVRLWPDRFRVDALVAGCRWEILLDQIREFRPAVVGLADEAAAAELRAALPSANGSSGASGPDPEILVGEHAARDACARDGIDLVVNGLVGSMGLASTLEALDRGTAVAIANKEVLVVAGELVMGAAQRTGADLFPLDSELCAIHQCLSGCTSAEIRRVLLTASGGPFRNLPAHRFAAIRPEDALNHPTWDMGPKITVDSATLMNKGLEVLETRWYFDIPYDRIEVVVHPQSLIHSMVETVDHSVMAQISEPDMRLPIQYALTYPERVRSGLPPFDPVAAGELTFEEPDLERFPCLRLAREAGEAGGTAPAVLNAANEIAVEAFLEGGILFTQIPEVVEECLQTGETDQPATLENLERVDGFTRDEARRAVGARSGATRATGQLR